MKLSYFKLLTNKILEKSTFVTDFLSLTPFYAVFVVFATFGIFGNVKTSYFSFFCFIFIAFLLVFSLILPFLLKGKKEISFIATKKKSNFIENFLTARGITIQGLSPLIIFVFTILILILINYLTFSIEDYQQFSQLEKMRESIPLFYRDGEINKGDFVTDAFYDRTKNYRPQGILTKIANYKIR